MASKITYFKYSADTSGNEILVFGDVTDANNEIKITNAANSTD